MCVWEDRADLHSEMSIGDWSHIIDMPGHRYSDPSDILEIKCFISIKFYEIKRKRLLPM